MEGIARARAEPDPGWIGRGAATALPLAVLTVAAAFTFLAWRAARAGEERTRRADFEMGVQDVEALVLQRMRAHEQVLRGAQGLFEASITVERAEFRAYVASLRLAESYPGIQGVGFSVAVPAARRAAHVAGVRAEGYPGYDVWPGGHRDPCTSILFLEPFGGRNKRAFGFDMLSEPVRRAAMERARDTGRAALSGKVTLVQETERDVQAGTLLYLPLYRPGAATATVEQRRSALLGWVYSPYRMDDLMEGILGERSRGLHIELYDGPAAAPDAMLFDSHVVGVRAHPGERELHSVRPLDVAGRYWTLVVHDLPGALPLGTFSRSTLLAAAGGSASVALALLVWLLAAGRIRAIEASHRASRALEERHRAAEELEAARRFAQDTLDAMPELICVLDEEGKILSVNRSWREAGGGGAAPGSASPGRPYLEASGPSEDGDSSLAARLRELLDGRERAFSLERAWRAGAERRWTQVRATRFEDLGRARVVVVHSDMTERCRSEEALLAATRLAAVGTLAAGVAHEINNPLAWIQGDLQHGLELLRAADAPGAPPVDGEEMRRALAEALEGAQRIAGVVKAMRSLGRPERPESAHPVDVRAEMMDAIQLTRAQLQQSACLEVDLPEGLPPVQARTSELGRVFLNLLVNAAQAIGPGRSTEHRIVVAARPEGREVVVEVTDSGPGIPPAIRDRIFEPFFTTKPVGEGTGLGLSIARSIVVAVGGRIEAESPPGRGTTLRVRLPVACEAAAAPAARPGASARAGPRRCVLVVDDEPLVARALQRALTPAHDVTVLGSAEEALRRLDAGERWDAMLFDLMMAGVDGVAVHGALSSRHPALLSRLAFVTGGAFGERAATFLSSNDVTVLAKPVPPERLRDAVEALASAERAGER